MAVNLSPVFGVAGQLFDNNGNPLAGGKIYTYLAGTTTNVATYVSSAGNVAHTNPIILDGAGRVPSGEIWLTDGITYKFVVEDSANNLIGTYDNLVGINSNFVNYTNQQEIQTATAGQTVFTLATMQYQPGTNSLSVFVDGVNQYGPGAQYAFVETSSTVVTFVSGLHVGAEVKFTTSQLNSSAATDASQVSYEPPFTGYVATNVEAKLSKYVSDTDFATIQDAIDWCLSFGGPAPVLEITQTHTITPGNPLIINRPTSIPSQSRGKFTIRGRGAQAGFALYGVSGTNFIFENNIVGFSENIVFDNVWFQSDHAGYSWVINGDDFIRVSFNDCYFQEIACVTASSYLQTWYFTNCKIVSWNKWFADCTAFYDLQVIGCQFESGNYPDSGGFAAFDPLSATSTQKAVFISNLYENSTKAFVSIQSGKGVVVSGNYFELNTDPELDFQQGIPAGVVVTGNSFDLGPLATNPNHAPIVVSYPNGFVGAGNFSNGRVYRFLNQMIENGTRSGGSWGQGDYTTNNGYIQATTYPIDAGIRTPGTITSTRPDAYEIGMTYGLGYNASAGEIHTKNTGASRVPIVAKQTNNVGTYNNWSVKSDGTFAINISSAGVTLDENLTMAFFEASPTQLRITVKGSDGVLRTANLTLS